MLPDMGSGSGCSPPGQICKRVLQQTCPERLHGLRVDGVNDCSVWSKALQMSLTAVTSLRLLENTPGWLSRALLMFCLDGMCLLCRFTTGLQITHPSSSVAALCLSVSTALLRPCPAPHHDAKHSTTHKVCSSRLRLTNSVRGAVILFWGTFQTFFSFKPHFCFAEYHFLSRFSPWRSPTAN